MQEKDNAMLVEVINCIMSDRYPHMATEKCMESLGITQPSYQDIEDCHASPVGENLLHDYGLQTEALEPKCVFVPWVIFNGVSYN